MTRSLLFCLILSLSHLLSLSHSLSTSPSLPSYSPFHCYTLTPHLVILALYLSSYMNISVYLIIFFFFLYLVCRIWLNPRWYLDIIFLTYILWSVWRIFIYRNQELSYFFAFSVFNLTKNPVNLFEKVCLPFMYMRFTKVVNVLF